MSALREYRIQATLGQHVDPPVVLRLVEALEDACKEAEEDTSDFVHLAASISVLKDRDTDDWKEANEKIDSLTKDVERLEADNASLNDRVANVRTYAELEAAETARDAAIAERDAIATAAHTWTATKLSAFILETAERQRLENERLLAEAQRLTAGVQKLTRAQRAKVGL